MSFRTITLKIKRQRNPETSPYWEEFKVRVEERLTVVSLLKKIRENPINARGEAVEPVVWEGDCSGGQCGGCAMIINGKPSLACETYAPDFDQLMTLEPLSRLPTLRDLIVDRAVIEKNIKELKLWIPVDSSILRTLIHQVPPSAQQESYALSQCIQCGLCLEVCPQFNERSSFIGAHALVLADQHLKGASSSLNREAPLTRLMQKGGVDDCGNDQSCVKACPREIPLTTAIASLKREVIKEGFKRFFGK